MTMKTLMATAAIAVALPITAIADSAENKAFVLEALENTLLAGDVDAVDQYFATDIIQHNDMFANGIEAQKGVVGFLSGNGDFSAEYIRVIADDNIVAVHARYEGFGPDPVIGFDVFRVEDGKIAEHWDNLITEQPLNPSGRSQIDGATEITDLDQTEANKALVEDFLTKSLIEHAEVNITDYISPVTYIQHNPMVADGLEGFGAFMAEMAQQGISMDYTKVHKVIGEGNFVLTMSEGTLGEDPTAFYDLFRVEDGLIVEHWDVIAPMPAADAAHNEAGKF
ncbi:nuclear transport factor 2 family protein [Loktanella sp. F6476L]|uniref:nuclear transport factor 2 family protein n=1 Tax=Loktanella sp. F6476L TaxID=2926405 RepID=UPI001FF61075|nr:nuclear transport factor 2 family protein [Loktanella sp. F6476L]MCK0121581.1 nuclear transport factor 2 family protein [Loktanella sp. F6476L]